MRVAMGTLAVLALVGGFVQIPGVTDVIAKFLEPTFADSTIAAGVDVTVKDSYLGLVVGAICSFIGIAGAFYLYLVATGATLRLRDRLRPIHSLLLNKWYFDELIDLLIYRPVLALGRFANSTVERVLVQGAIVGGASGGVRGLGAAVRTAQSGFVRFYALMVVAGMAGLGLYFLLVAN
jgi:NADH-quinone oxidoreductase subunit L